MDASRTHHADSIQPADTSRNNSPEEPPKNINYTLTMDKLNDYILLSEIVSLPVTQAEEVAE